MHSNRRSRLLLATLGLLSFGVLQNSGVSAQTRELDAGTRVRVRLERNPLRIVGLVAEVRPDTLVLARPTSRLERMRPMPVADIAELEISGGHRRLTVIGFAVGALAGLGLTAAYNSIVQSQCFSNCPAHVSGGIGAAVGSVVLGGGFYFIRVERWHPIAVPSPRNPVR